MAPLFFDDWAMLKPEPLSFNNEPGSTDFSLDQWRPSLAL